MERVPSREHHAGAVRRNSERRAQNHTRRSNRKFHAIEILSPKRWSLSCFYFRPIRRFARFPKIAAQIRVKSRFTYLGTCSNWYLVNFAHNHAPKIKYQAQSKTHSTPNTKSCSEVVLTPKREKQHFWLRNPKKSQAETGFEPSITSFSAGKTRLERKFHAISAPKVRWSQQYRVSSHFENWNRSQSRFEI